MVSGRGFGLATILVAGALVFATSHANAGFFDKLNESLDAAKAGMAKAQAGVDDAKMKAGEAKTDIDKTKANLNATKAEGDDALSELKGLASLNDD